MVGKGAKVRLESRSLLDERDTAAVLAVSCREINKGEILVLCIYLNSSLLVLLIFLSFLLSFLRCIVVSCALFFSASSHMLLIFLGRF